jgi:hypothetical protein
LPGLVSSYIPAVWIDPEFSPAEYVRCTPSIVTDVFELHGAPGTLLLHLTCKLTWFDPDSFRNVALPVHWPV